MTTSTLLKRYRFIKVIGKGGMGTVHLAEDLEKNIHVAIKEVLIKDRNKSHILSEPLLLKRFNHENIVKVYDILDLDDRIYIVMEYIDGGSLRDLIVREAQVTKDEIINWMIQLGSAIEYLHNLEPYPVVYRDIKPGNILIDSNKRVVLIDFGIACEYRNDEYLDEVPVALTRGYCAPEQYLERKFDTRSDIYSFGITLYHLLTGINPPDNYFDIEPIKKVNPDISTELEYIITKTIQINPDERYQCIEDLIYDLVNIKELIKDYKKSMLRQNLIYAGFLIMYIIFFSITFTGYTTLKASTVITVEGALDSANNNFLNKKYTETLNDLEKALRINPNDSRIYLRILDYYYSLNRYQEGINFLKTNKDYIDNIKDLKEDKLLYYGKFYLGLGFGEEASQYFNELIKIDPNNDEYLFYIVLSYIDSSKIDNANFIIGKLENKISDDKFNYLLASRNKKIQKYNEAIINYNNILNESNDQELLINSYIGKAEVYKLGSEVFENNYKLSTITLEEGINKFNGNIKLIESKIEIYKYIISISTDIVDKKLNIELVISDYYKLIENGKEDLRVYLDIASFYIDLENYKESEVILLEAIAKYPESFDVYYLLTIVQFKIELIKIPSQRDYSLAEKNLEKTRELGVKTNRNNEVKNLEESIENYKKQ